MSPSPFPDTDRTWIVEHLERGAHEQVRNHLMQVYAEPLQLLCRRRLGLDEETALDLVHGFFASRLERPDYLRDWDQRDVRLRSWLWRGLDYYLKERRRADRRLQTVPELPDEAAAYEPDLARELDRAFATALVRAAMQAARAACLRDGLTEHWQVFERRQTGGQRLVDIARDLGITPDRALVMLRAPTLRFRQAVGELLAADGVPAAELPRALRALQEAIL